MNSDELKQLLADVWEHCSLQDYAEDRDIRGLRWYYSDPVEHDKAIALVGRVRAVLTVNTGTKP
jgi:hypothetical protein